MNKGETINYVVSYAQNREDIILNGLLSGIENGRYIDIGANHPVFDSVTYLFYKKGWSGINIEPNIALHKELERARPNDTNLNIGVGNKTGTGNIRIYNNKDGLSTLSDKMKILYEHSDTTSKKDFVDKKIKVLTLKDIVLKYNIGEVHFMKIDVEGYEHNVIKGNNWKTFRPWVLCIEANHIISSDKNWLELLADNNYQELFDDGLNKYFVANEHSDIAQNFSYVETILSRPIVSFDIDKAIREKTDIKRELNQLKKTNIRLNQEVSALQYQIATSARIKGAIKQLVRAVDHIIVTRINNLNKPHIKKYISTNESLLPDSKYRLDDAVRAIRLYDFERYYSTKITSPIMYTVLNRSYRFMTRKPVKFLKYLKLRLSRIG